MMFENINVGMDMFSVTNFILFLIFLQLTWIGKKVGSLNWKLIQLMERPNIKRPSQDEDMSDP